MLTLPGNGSLFAVAQPGQPPVPISITMVQPSESEANQSAASIPRSIRLTTSSASLSSKPQVTQIFTSQSAAQMTPGTGAGRPALRVVIPNSRVTTGNTDVSISISFFRLKLMNCNLGF